MIEKTVLDYLDSKLSVPAFMETKGAQKGSHVLIEKTSSGTMNHVKSATLAIKSCADSLHLAAELNEEVKNAMEAIISLDEVCKVSLNSDYNYTDTTKKQYRYQAVFDLVHY